MDDIDLNLEDFVQRVNSDVVGKVVNIASRCAGFLRKGFRQHAGLRMRRTGVGASSLSDRGDGIAALYEQREFNKAIREIVALARQSQPVHR